MALIFLLPIKQNDRSGSITQVVKFNVMLMIGYVLNNDITALLL